MSSSRDERESLDGGVIRSGGEPGGRVDGGGEPAGSIGDGRDRAAIGVAGERGTAFVNSARSLQSRVSNVLAAGLMIALGGGALTWYYTNAIHRQSRAREVAQASAATRAQGEMPLPSLGRIDMPSVRFGDVGSSHALDGVRESGSPGVDPAPGAVLGVKPAASLDGGSGFGLATELPLAPAPTQAYGAPRPRSSAQLAMERRLSGVAFARQAAVPATAASGSMSAAFPIGPGAAEADNALSGISATGMPAAEPGTVGVSNGGSATSGAPDPQVAHDAVLVSPHPGVIPASRVQVLPTQRFLLAKGAFIDCTLETAIDSTLPGMATCITATDTFGVDGTVVLLERGTKLVGETRGQVQQGAARVFVLWSQARTPGGVIVPLESPGADELGRSGLPGHVNRHFWERFGAAILISTIQGAVQAGLESAGRGGGAVIYNPSASQDVLTEVFRSTLNIPPTIVKSHGDRIQVLVARDIDFRSVYELRSAHEHPATHTR